MASASFLERFKDRTSSLNSHGELDGPSSKPASRSNAFLVHESPGKRMKSTGEMIIRGESPSHRQSLSFSSGAKPTVLDYNLSTEHGRDRAISLYKLSRRRVQKDESIRKTVPETVQPVIIRASIEFTPYTQKEYETVKSTKYYELGGLGAAVGTEEWRRQKEVRDRRAEYARLIQDVNSARLPGSVTLQQDRNRKKMSSTRERAKELAKKTSKTKAQDAEEEGDDP